MFVPSPGEAPLGYDAISSASVGGGGGSSDGEGGDSKVMNANLIVDADLMNNALILKELGLGTEASDGIAERWNMNKLYVFNEGAEEVYDYVSYYDAVNTARVNNEYLSFAEYIADENADTTPNRPYAVKQILEDNLLGETSNFQEAVGKKAPALKLDSQTESSAVFSCADKAYLEALQNNGVLELNTSYPALSEDEYTVDPEAGTLTLHTVKVGKNSLKLNVEGYQTVEMIFEIGKELEEVELTAADGKEGTELVITCNTAHEVCDFFQNVTSVRIQAPVNADNAVNVRAIQKGDAEGAGYGYTVSGNTLTLGDKVFSEDFAHEDTSNAFIAGDYTITITSEYYGDKTVTAHVIAADAVTPEPDVKKDAPTVVSFEKASDILVGTFYRMTFESAEDLASYLDHAAIQVNGTDITRVHNLFKAEKSFKLGVVNDSSSTSAYDCIDFTADCFIDEAKQNIVITSENYQDLTYTADLTNPSKPDHKEEAPSGEVASKYGEHYQIDFGQDNNAYLREIKTVVVNGQEYSAGTYFLFNGQYVIDGSALKLHNSGFKKGQENTVTITSDTYKDKTVTITLDAEGNLASEGEGTPSVPEKSAPSVKAIAYKSSLLDACYRVSFDAAEEDAAAYLKAISAITANDTTLKHVSGLWNEKNSFIFANNDATGGDDQFIEFTKDCFAGEKTIVIKAAGYADLTFQVKDGELV